MERIKNVTVSMQVVESVMFIEAEIMTAPTVMKRALRMEFIRAIAGQTHDGWKDSSKDAISFFLSAAESIERIDHNFESAFFRALDSCRATIRTRQRQGSNIEGGGNRRSIRSSP